MVFETRFVRCAYAQVLAHEMKQAVRMLRALPMDRLDVRGHDCGWTGRELAEGLVAHMRRIDAIASGSTPAPAPRGPRTRGSMLLDLETHFLGAIAAIERLSSDRWSEVTDAPHAPHLRARRGELLWLALREWIRHERHLAHHVHGGCGWSRRVGEGGGHPVVAHEPLEPVSVSA